MRISILATLVAVLFLSLTPTLANDGSQPISLDLVWTVEGFANPESVALGPDGQTLFVSNVSGEGMGRDGEGYISRVSLSGELLELRWVQGLNAPKGVAIHEGTLFVTDIDELVMIDLASAEVINRIAVPGAIFLNDVAVSPVGDVLVSDSGLSHIQNVSESKIVEVVAGDWLAGVNGLLFQGDRLLISTMDTTGLFIFTLETAEVRQISGDVGQGDGIAALGDDNYLISEWPGRLFHVAADGATTTLLDLREEPTLMNDFILVGDLLVMPNWEPGTLRAYRLN